MKQQTFAVAGGFERFGRQSRRAEFLSQMELVVPWAELVALIEPHYPSSDKGRPCDRPGTDVADLLPSTVVQLVRSGGRGRAVRVAFDARLCRHRPGREPAPDETTVCKFRHLLERHESGQAHLRPGQRATSPSTG